MAPPLTNPPKNAQPATTTPEPAIKTLADVQTPAELKSFLQQHAATHWGAPPNTPLDKLFSDLPANVLAQGMQLASALNAALYAGKPMDIKALKELSRPLLSCRKHVPATPKHSIEKLPALNPEAGKNF